MKLTIYGVRILEFPGLRHRVAADLPVVLAVGQRHEAVDRVLLLDVLELAIVYRQLNDFRFELDERKDLVLERVPVLREAH